MVCGENAVKLFTADAHLGENNGFEGLIEVRVIGGSVALPRSRQ
ncbi:hypothetical protein Krac_2738 [Ktedonobacter racemifer DSM 44963]|uniref:Uncharacterized protein n=1 Tax=Ktedonobacter racemifer DSM 44963 TaxID=485913 RepID=D6TZH9_KTERA|nr:hypothetical protein Krac_2738 [Ktedonobacter racemifer DSM 44963]